LHSTKVPKLGIVFKKDQSDNQTDAAVDSKAQFTPLELGRIVKNGMVDLSAKSTSAIRHLKHGCVLAKIEVSQEGDGSPKDGAAMGAGPLPDADADAIIAARDVDDLRAKTRHAAKVLSVSCCVWEYLLAG